MLIWVTVFVFFPSERSATIIICASFSCVDMPEMVLRISSSLSSETSLSPAVPAAGAASVVADAWPSAFFSNDRNLPISLTSSIPLILSSCSCVIPPSLSTSIT